MSIVQESEISPVDSRWIPVRVSRINLGITVGGVLAACGILWLVPLPMVVRVGLAMAFLLASVWDLRLILLKGRQSVAAFYLYDLDLPRESDDTYPKSSAPKLGIRLRYARQAPDQAADEGIILNGAFVSPWFTTVRYALPRDARWRKWWPHIIPLWPDSMAPDAFRQLRVALRWK